MTLKKLATLGMALALAASLSATGTAIAQKAAAEAVSAGGLSYTERAELDLALDKMVEESSPYQVPGLGVILYKDGREVYSHFVGSRRLGKSAEERLPVTRDTRFRIASVSKQFTVFTLMELAEGGKLSLQDDVSKYLGFTLRNPAYPDTPITLEMLASHTSSLRNGGNEEDSYTSPPQESIEEFFRPGSPR